MIPKVIHYIWLGGKPLPKIAEKCIKSWEKFCPDYEIKRWDESNIDLDSCKYTREAYDAKKYAFVADSVRLDILKKEGGIYLDIDVEIIAPIDKFLEDKAILAFENNEAIAPGLVMACEKESSCLDDLIEVYQKESFVMPDGTFNLETICQKITKYLVGFGLRLDNSNQNILDFSIYSSEYFCPKSLSDGVIRKTKNTVAIHHYYGSWHKKSTKIKHKIKQFIKRLVGPKLVNKLKEKRKKQNENSSSSSK